jgi:hypothetical protein
MALTPEEKAAAKAAKEEEKAAAKAGTDSVTVTWNGGERVFTRDEHGDDFAELAKEFAESHDRNGTVA